MLFKMELLQTLLLLVGIYPNSYSKPMRIQSEPVRRIEAKLSLHVKAPSLEASEWIFVAPKCPELPCQSNIRASLDKQYNEKMEASPLRRPILMLRLPVRQPQLQSQIDVQYTCSALLYKRKLVPIAPNERVAAVPPLPSDLQKAYLATNTLVNHDHPNFRSWMVNQGLKRAAGESELEFAHRVFHFLHAKMHYEYEKEMDRRVSVVCKNLKTDCGGMSCMMVGILRANGIPARILVGRWAQSAEAEAKLGGIAYYQTHVKAECFIANIGWVPFDLSSAVNAEASIDPASFFGQDPGDFLVFHVDYDLQVDTVHFGIKSIVSMQGIQYWAKGSGDFSDQKQKESWLVKPLPVTNKR